MKIKILMLASLALVLVACAPNTDDSMMDSDSKTETSTDSGMMDDSMNGEDGVMVGGAMMVPSKDIVDNAMESNDHTTLVAAVSAADLVGTLKGDGPFTVFAPTNAAFDKLPEGTVDDLLMPENKDQLTGVLTYHVVPGSYIASDITDGMSLETVNGEMLAFTVRDGQVWINNSAQVTIADVISSNGVTHVIDTVLLP